MKNHWQITNNLNHLLGSQIFTEEWFLILQPKMLTLNNKKNNNFSWVKLHQTTFADIKSELCANPILLPYSLQKEATVTTDASAKKILSGFFRKKDIKLYLFI